MRAKFAFAFSVYFCNPCFASEEMYVSNMVVSGNESSVVVTGDYPEPYGKTKVALFQSKGVLSSLAFESEIGAFTIPVEHLGEVISPHLLDARLTWSLGMDEEQKVYVSVYVPFSEPSGEPPLFPRKSFTIVDGELSFTILQKPIGGWYESTYVEINGNSP